MQDALIPRPRLRQEARLLACFADSAALAAAIPVTPVRKADLAAWLGGQPARLAAWVAATAFKAEPDSLCLIPAEDGGVERVLLGLDDPDCLWSHGGLPKSLPPGTYRLDGVGDAAAAALGWALGSYRFDRYKPSGNGNGATRLLALASGIDRAAIERAAEATFLVRDLINTPASDMGPAELAQAAGDMAALFGASVEVIVGEDLLARNYPAIHAVGRASARAPRLIDIRWGDPAAPKVTLVGKGVCFDSGGLDLKPSSAMKLMKKDMGGAAIVLGLARMIMGAGLNLRLRVLVPAVENSVSGAAMRPLDVLATRKGLSVEIGNTDAEGRLILCDALAEADAEDPALIVDCATLTGAARSALGTDLPALFCNDEAFAADLLRHGTEQTDPMWRLPLWKGYRKMIDGKIASLTNATDSPYAGAITAALFLQEFVSPGRVWAHLDMMAWNTASRPGRPEGGEAMAMRALYAFLHERFGTGRQCDLACGGH